jgi:hypothetical protein
MKRIRLVITFNCDRACAGCCNKQIDWAQIPKLSNVLDIPTDCDMVILTGGEPTLNATATAGLAHAIKQSRPDIQVIMYTAGTNMRSFEIIAPFVDGITYTVHEPKDVEFFTTLVRSGIFTSKQSRRANVFSPMTLNGDALGWDVREGYKWLDECPLPDDEHLMKWNG